MTSIDQLAVLVEQNAAFAEAVSRPGALSVRTPSCPGWTVRELVEHLTEVQSFWRTAVGAGGEVPGEPKLEPGADVLEQWHRAADALVAELRATSPDAPSWAWWPADNRTTVAAITRRMAHEALIHRWDAQRAVGEPGPFGVDLAADGVAEFAGTMLRNGGSWTGPSGVVQLYAEDAGQAWIVGVGSVPGVVGGLPTWLRDKRLREVNAHVQGSAEQLDLALWGRVSLDELSVAGDRPLVSALFGRRAGPALDCGGQWVEDETRPP